MRITIKLGNNSSISSNVDIPAIELIKELRNKLPDCDKCGPHGDARCMKCIWRVVNILDDNYKENI